MPDTNPTGTENLSVNPVSQPPVSISDVTGPGKTPASATSRPVVVGHTMIANDPMVVDPEVKRIEEESQGLKTTTRELKLQPEAIPGNVIVAEPEVMREEQVTSESSAIMQKNSKPDGTGKTETVAVDSLMEEVDAKQAERKQKKELEERVLEIEKTIELKEFFVPIGAESRRRSNKRIIWVSIALILLVAGGGYVFVSGSAKSLGL